MRNAITISLPDVLLKEVKQEVKAGKFASVSEYIRHVLRENSRARLARELRAQTKQFAEGKGIRLNSLKDLR